MKHQTAAAQWLELSGQRSALMDKIERLAQLTLPTVMLPAGATVESYSINNTATSFGAEAVTKLVAKLMTAMFDPGSPSFVLEPSPALIKEFVAARVDPDEAAEVLSRVEREAVKALDRTAQRPVLYRVCEHLIVAGQVLLNTRDPEKLRALGLRFWCVKRDIHGEVIRLLIRECLAFEELVPEVREAVPLRSDDDEVSMYTWIERQPDGRYKETLWVDDFQLPDKFSSTYKRADSPWHVLTWKLPDCSDYAVSHAEELSSDLEVYNALSEAVANGAAELCDVRRLIAEGSTVRVEDWKKGRSGDTYMGRKDDISVVSGGDPISLQQASVVLDRYERRLSRAFLMTSSVIRDAERVTREEVRMLQNELEQSLGGIYSELAGNLQRAVAFWLLRSIKVPFSEKHLSISVVTGLDALSRYGEMEAMVRGLEILAKVSALPPDLQQRLNMDALTRRVGRGVGQDLSDVLLTAEQLAERQQQAIAAQATQAGAVAGAEAQAQGMQ